MQALLQLCAVALLLHFHLHLESELLLCNIAETYHQYGCEYLGNGRVEVADLHEEFHEHIVKEQANPHQYKIPDQLYPSPQVGFGENDVFVQQKARREADEESHEHRGNMRTDRQERQVHHLLVQDEVIADREQDNVQQRVPPAAREVAEGLERHQPRKRPVKECQYVKDQVLHLKFERRKVKD